MLRLTAWHCNLAFRHSRWLTLGSPCIRSSSATLSTYAGHLEPKKGDRVIVAMSGGVDSSVTAKLLTEKDYDLSAVFMRNWDTRDESGSDIGCEWEKDWDDVQNVCRLLDIPCQMIDLSREYWTRVFEPSIKAWEAGETPNPDVWCNREIKFGAMLDQLISYPTQPSNSWFASGHYARKSWTNPSSPTAKPKPKLLRARDRTKDQTYYLSAIPSSSLSRSIFPIGDFTKVQVREMAKKWCLPTAERSESMGLCFIGEKKKFDEFISQYIPPMPGPILLLTTGAKLGTHQGLWTYTIGQNFKLGGQKQRLFVARKYPSHNTIHVVPGSDHEELYCRSISCKDWNWIWRNEPPSGLDAPGGMKARTQFRHVMYDVECTVMKEGNGNIRITFDEPQRAVANGQIAALWDLEEEWCLGSGTIFSSKSRFSSNDF